MIVLSSYPRILIFPFQSSSSRNWVSPLESSFLRTDDTEED